MLPRRAARCDRNRVEVGTQHLERLDRARHGHCRGYVILGADGEVIEAVGSRRRRAAIGLTVFDELSSMIMISATPKVGTVDTSMTLTVAKSIVLLQ